MDTKEWKKLIARSMTLLAIVLLFGVVTYIYKHGNQEQKVHAQGQSVMEEALIQQHPMERQEATAFREEKIRDITDTYIRIGKLENVQAQKVYLDNEYLDFSISLTLKGIPAGEYNKQQIQCVWKGKDFSMKEGVKKKFLTQLTIGNYMESDIETVRIRMQFDDVYEPVLYETAEAYYIALKKPEELYDKIIVVDAGHGGMDEGTASVNGKHCEKMYTLKVAKCLQEIYQDNDAKIYFTRLHDTTLSTKERTDLANAVHASAFVSIHCNASTLGDTASYGIEALYSGRAKASSSTLTSKQLAQSVQKYVHEETGRRDRGVIQRKDLYLMNHSKVPVTIIEIGYMTNTSDLNYIMREKNQKKIARGIYKGIEAALSEEI